MKKNVIILMFLFTASLTFAAEKFAKKNQGTYIPVIMYEKIRTGKSYYEGIKNTISNVFYTVLCITENEVLSNIKFHDAYKLNAAAINFSFKNKNNQMILIDKNTNINYVKISDSTDYYTAFDTFLIENIISKIQDSSNNLEINPDNTILLFDENWRIDKDQWHYSDKLEIILYSKKSNRYIGLSNNIFYILKDSEELAKEIDKEIL